MRETGPRLVRCCLREGDGRLSPQSAAMDPAPTLQFCNSWAGASRKTPFALTDRNNTDQ